MHQGKPVLPVPQQSPSKMLLLRNNTYTAKARFCALVKWRQ